MMHVGDEVEFALNADSLQAIGMRMPAIYKAGEGQLMKFRMKLHAVKTEEQLMQEQQEKMEKMKAEEQPAREKYIADKQVRMEDLSINPSLVSGDHAAKLSALQQSKAQSADLAMTAFIVEFSSMVKAISSDCPLTGCRASR